MAQSLLAVLTAHNYLYKSSLAELTVIHMVICIGGRAILKK